MNLNHFCGGGKTWVNIHLWHYLFIIGTGILVFLIVFIVKKLRTDNTNLDNENLKVISSMPLLFKS